MCNLKNIHGNTRRIIIYYLPLTMRFRRQKKKKQSYPLKLPSKTYLIFFF